MPIFIFKWLIVCENAELKGSDANSIIKFKKKGCSVQELSLCFGPLIRKSNHLYDSSGILKKHASFFFPLLNYTNYTNFEISKVSSICSLIENE